MCLGVSFVVGVYGPKAVVHVLSISNELSISLQEKSETDTTFSGLKNEMEMNKAFYHSQLKRTAQTQSKIQKKDLRSVSISRCVLASL